MNGGPRFLPDRLRPKVSRRRSRRRFALFTVFPVALVLLPMWRIGEVRVESCPAVPRSTERSLAEMVGEPTVALDLAEIRDRVEVWPGVGAVEVRLELPTTLVVRAEPAEIAGSVLIGMGWHGVDPTGAYAGTLDFPLCPVLEGFAGSERDQRRALEVVRRLEAASEMSVTVIRKVAPDDYRVDLVSRSSPEAWVAHVSPEGTASEQAWISAVGGGALSAPWADLRQPDRMVIGGSR